MGVEKFQYWEEVTVEEIKAYIGFMILMGIAKLTAISDYWKLDEVLHYAPRRISKIGSLISKGISILWIIHLFLLIPVLTTINWEKFDQLLPFFVRDFVQYTTFIEK